MTNDDVNLIGDELRGLADDIVATAPVAARDRARQGIARRQRNRRAAAGAGAVVLIVAATVFVAVGRDTKDTQRPAGTAVSTPSTVPATATPTSTPRTTPSSTGVTSPIVITIPPLNDLRAATASYSKAFAWGSADDEVAFQVPHGEGVSGGPVAFTADTAGNIVMLDHSSSRIVRFEHGSAAAVHIALASPAVTAAAIDTNGHVIVATVGDVAEFGPDGRAEGSWPAVSQAPITSLSIVADFVYSVTDHNTRTPILRETGPNFTYTRLTGAVPEPTPIVVNAVESGGTGVIHIAAGDVRYEITTGFQDVRMAKVLPDGTLVFVAGVPQSGSGNMDFPQRYVLVRIDPFGHARYETVAAATGYLVNGPGFVINDDGLAVMSSTTTTGLTVSYYPFS